MIKYWDGQKAGEELKLMLETCQLNSYQKEAVFIGWKILCPHCGVCKYHKEAKVFYGLKRSFVLCKCHNPDSYHENRYTRYDIVCEHFEMDERNFDEWMKEVNDHEEMLSIKKISKEKKEKTKRKWKTQRIVER